MRGAGLEPVPPLLSVLPGPIVQVYAVKERVAQSGGGGWALRRLLIEALEQKDLQVSGYTETVYGDGNSSSIF